MVATQEQLIFGWLGRIPQEIIDADASIVKEYMRLSKDAEMVAHMKETDAKIRRAKKIEERYDGLVEQARRQVR